ncbi:hypothetical protein BDQ17DRAFT_1411584 [Cyathus striatus]|nr:hypothetical protein BDQ17DRAFT_1411584 [Cyathus striatus]
MVENYLQNLGINMGQSDLGSYRMDIDDKAQRIGMARSISEHVFQQNRTLLNIYQHPSREISLQSEVKVQWNEGFELGQGIDAITGARKASALQPFTIPPERTADDHKQQSGYRAISSISEVFNEDIEGLAATVNVGLPERLGMSIEWSTLTGFSATSSIVEYYLKDSFGFEQPIENSLAFTSEAQHLLNDPQRFREYYGDYFICGYQRQYRFHAIVSFKSEEQSKESDIDVGIGLDSGIYGGLSGSFKRNRKNHNSSTVENFLYVISGFSPAATKDIASVKAGITEDALLRILDSVQAMDCKGVRQIALLRHYSNLCPGKISNTISGISLLGDWRKIFSELHQLDRCCLKFDFNLYHPAVRPDIIIKARRAVLHFRQKRESLVYEDSSRRMILDSLQQLDVQVEKMIENSTYIQNGLKDQRYPPKGPIESFQANAAWKYGIASCEEARVCVPYDFKDGVCASHDINVKRVNIRESFLGWEAFLKYVEPGELLRNFSRKAKSQRFIEFTSASMLPNNTRDAESYAVVENPGRFYNAPHKDHPVTILGFTVTFNNKGGKRVRFKIVEGGLLHNRLKIQITDIPRECVCHCRVTYVELSASSYGLTAESG